MPLFPAQPRGSKASQRLALAVKVAASAAVISLALEYGFDEPPVPGWLPLGIQLLTVALYLGQYVHILATAHRLLIGLKKQWLDTVIIVAAVVVLAASELSRQPILKASAVYVITFQVVLVCRFALGMARIRLASSQGRLRPARLMVSSFVVVIAVGGALLSLPRAVVPELRHETGDYLAKRILNSCFTATSATCVTGLVVYDTGKDLTRFGQIVVLMLIQLGGLGIMTFGTLFGMLAGRRLSLRDSLVLQDTMSHQTIGQVSQMVWFIVIATLGCEAVGAVVLYATWPVSAASGAERVFHSVFHAVSAFCNAGFALDGRSLVPYRGVWGVYVAIMPLIVLGGLGFPVLYDLFRRCRSILPRRLSVREPAAIRIPRARSRARHHRMSLHTRIALFSTTVLIVLPAVALFIFESSAWRTRSQKPGRGVDPESTAVMADMTYGDRAAAALFQSVTARTAGFNTAATDVRSMSTASHFLLCILMFVGGSPASTAGGVKTIAVAVLLLAIYSTLRRRRRVEVLGRTVPDVVVRRAEVVVVVMLTVVAVITLALCYTERGWTTQEILFESVSACGTVGLSTGLTPHLTIAGRVIIMVAMFAGRLGPLTVLIALAGREETAPYDYPEEAVVIG